MSNTMDVNVSELFAVIGSKQVYIEKLEANIQQIVTEYNAKVTEIDSLKKEIDTLKKSNQDLVDKIDELTPKDNVVEFAVEAPHNND